MTILAYVESRSFAYNGENNQKELRDSQNTIIGQYRYDANGNLTRKTDARGVVTSYVYDALNRVTQRSYSTPNGTPGVGVLANYQATPNVSYFYDDVNVPFSKGRLTKVTSSISETRYNAFDNLGRVLSSSQVTDGQTYNFTYTYNLSGALIEQTYPSGRVVKNVLESDGDLSMVQSKKTANSGFFNYAKHFTYAASGAVTSMRLGNGLWESTQFNSRLQPVQIGLGTSATDQGLLKLNYDYGTTQNNGNVLSQQITVQRSNQSPLVFTQSYVYDTLNRLKSAEEKDAANATTWRQTYTFDRYGNRRFDQSNTTFPASFSNPNVTNPQIDATNNRFATGQGWTYDLAGNVITDAEGRSFTYDGENKQKEVRDQYNTVIGQYYFDGDGRRVKKIVPSTGETTVFVYDASNKLVAEYSTIVEPTSTAKTSYLTNDHLGSPRINTDATGNVIARHDYMPFGEEIYTAQRTQSLGYTADTVRKQFTGYERDIESDLDYANARYYKPAHGRFTSTDPSLTTGRLFSPQTWNRYAYVLNNPLVFTDPTGMYECSGTEKQCKNFDSALQKANEQLAKIEKRYGKSSTEYTDAVRALNSYGKLGDKNGVTVGFGQLAKGTLGETSGSLDAKGNKSITVTIDPDQNRNNSDFMITIAHEGSHVQDHADYQDALIAAGKIGTEEAVNKVLSGVITHGASETRAFGVSSVFAEFTLGGSAGPQMGGGTFVLGGEPEKSITVGGESIWKSSWQKLDIEKIRANRSAAIEKGLKKDPVYSPKLNKPIE